jgi:hypothetical protein
MPHIDAATVEHDRSPHAPDSGQGEYPDEFAFPRDENTRFARRTKCPSRSLGCHGGSARHCSCSNQPLRDGTSQSLTLRIRRALDGTRRFEELV